MSFSFKKIALITALAGSVGLAAGVAQAAPRTAQSQAMSHATRQAPSGHARGQSAMVKPAAPKPATHYSRADIENFVGAARQIHAIRGKAQPKIKALEHNPKAFAKFRHQIIDQMISAIKAHHLSTHQYNAIARDARTHPKLRAEVMGMLNGHKKG